MRMSVLSENDLERRIIAKALVDQTGNQKSASQLQFRKRGRFCRRCLQNLRGWPREKERSHLRKVAPTKASPKTWLQIFGKLSNEGLSVFRPLLPPLFGFHDTASDLPICCSHQRVHASSGSVSGSLKQRDNIVTDFVLSRWVSGIAIFPV